MGSHPGMCPRDIAARPCSRSLTCRASSASSPPTACCMPLPAGEKCCPMRWVRWHAAWAAAAAAAALRQGQRNAERAGIQQRRLCAAIAAAAAAVGPQQQAAARRRAPTLPPTGLWGTLWRRVAPTWRVTWCASCACMKARPAWHHTFWTSCWPSCVAAHTVSARLGGFCLHTLATSAGMPLSQPVRAWPGPACGAAAVEQRGTVAEAPHRANQHARRQAPAPALQAAVAAPVFAPRLLRGGPGRDVPPAHCNRVSPAVAPCLRV